LANYNKKLLERIGKYEICCKNVIKKYEFDDLLEVHEKNMFNFNKKYKYM